MANAAKKKTTGERNDRRPNGKAFKKNPGTNRTTGKSILGIRRDKFLLMYGLTNWSGALIVPEYELKDRIETFVRHERAAKAITRGMTATERRANYLAGPGRHRSEMDAKMHRAPKSATPPASKKDVDNFLAAKKFVDAVLPVL